MSQETGMNFDVALNGNNDDDDIDLAAFYHNAWLPQAAYRQSVDEGIFKSIMERERRKLDMFRSKERIVIADLKDCMVFGYMKASSLTDIYFLGLVQCVEGYNYEKRGTYLRYPAYKALTETNCVGIATFPAQSGDSIIGAIQNVVQVLTEELDRSVELIVVKTSVVPGLPPRVIQIIPMDLLRHDRLHHLARYMLEAKYDMNVHN